MSFWNDRKNIFEFAQIFLLCREIWKRHSRCKKLFVTQSAVSKQIFSLEETLNIALFQRKNKSLVLTNQGTLLLQCCQNIFHELDECLIEVTKQNFENKQLVLSCEPTFSMKWLIPRLSKFKAQYDDFDIVLLTAGGKVDFENNHIDIAIRRNDFDWGDHIHSEKIADEYMVMIESTQIEKSTDLLISNSRPYFWKNLNQSRILKTIIGQYSKVDLEHFYLCLEGCLAGLGATIISIYMIEKEMEFNFIKTIMPPFRDESAYYLLSKSSFEEDPRKLIFLNWLKNEMEDSQGKFLK